ncbi:MAG: diguanylate cyclase [Eubacteriales bacterium]|nr:diguanylate cyclase [Eubacteriales bacterium]
MEEDMLSQIEALQDSSTEAIQNEMDHLKYITASTAQVISHAKIQTDEDIIQILKEYAETSDIVWTYFITLDGHVYTNYTGYAGQYEEATVINDIPISNITDTVFSRPYYVEKLDEVVWGVGAPTTLGKRRGILLSAYKVSNFSLLLDNNLIGESAGLGIVNNQGDVISGRTSADYMINIFDTMKDTKFLKSSMKEMQADFENGKPGISMYSVRGVKRYCSYTPVGENDWYFIMTVRESALRQKLVNFEQYGFQLTVKLVIIMVCIFFVIIANWLVEQKRTRKILEDAARMDGLTGIYNRKAIEENIEGSLSAGKNSPAALLVIDIDDFKKINDQKGHLFGDYVLQECANSLKESFGSEGLIGRIGGDEFVVFLYDGTDMGKIEERVNNLIRNFNVLTEEGERQMVFISVGIAHAGEEADSFRKLYKKADDALYRAKQTGKAKLSE